MSPPIVLVGNPAVRLEAEGKDPEPDSRQPHQPSRSRRHPLIEDAGPGSPENHGPQAAAKLHAEFAATRDPGLEAQLLEYYEEFALSVVRRFGTRRDLSEDLRQVARLGLLHALRRFDPDRGPPFVAFARLTIDGELKRHVRDRTWNMRVGRSLQERYLEVMRAGDDLRHRHGRSPTIPEIAQYLRFSDEQVLEAMELARGEHPISLNRRASGTEGHQLEVAVEDAAFIHIEDRDLIESLLARLSPYEREIIRLRFVGQLTQAEIATRLGVSQMCISRQLTRILARLRMWAR